MSGGQLLHLSYPIQAHKAALTAQTGVYPSNLGYSLENRDYRSDVANLRSPSPFDLFQGKRVKYKMEF